MSTIEKSKVPFGKKSNRLPVILASAGALVICLVIVFVSAGLLLSKGGRLALGQWLPIFGRSLTVTKPTQAVVQEELGIVQLMDTDGQWQSGEAGSVLEAGMHLRTGALSSATLAFYDGSQVVIGPQAELAIEQLQAGKGDEERVIVLTQITGESEHQVVVSTQTGSRYEVRTAAASGEATGTRFTVSVNSNQGTMFQVNEGKLSVTGSDVTVEVQGGQTTVVDMDGTPAEPMNYFAGQGTVTFIGEPWVVAGQALTTNDGTVITGNPQVGDEVNFEGRLLADNSRLVDLIVLQQRSPSNRFSLTGNVEIVADIFWTINGQEIAVTDITTIDPNIVVGDLVEVNGLIMNDGTLQGETIRRLEETPGRPFVFLGVVQRIESGTWVVSDIEFVTTENTTISNDLVVGDMVRVTGWIIRNGEWQTNRIEETFGETSEFEFTGRLENINPWRVAGVSFETRNWTVIDAGLRVGNQVRVTGQVMSDGAWVASEIRLLDDQNEDRIVLVGVVTSMDPWIVRGITFSLDAETLISPEVVLGMLVRVEIQVLDDGAWKVIRIDPFSEFQVPGNCQEVTGVLVSISGNQVQLDGWPVMTLGEGAFVDDDLQPNSIVLVKICYDENGNLQIEFMYHIRQPGENGPPYGNLPGERVEICHKPHDNNPHTIVVSQSAVPAHLGHGDVLGACLPQESQIIWVGVVTSINPWIVNDVTLNVDEETFISPEVVTGMLVRVEIQVLEDGSWKVIRIDPVNDFEQRNSCQEVSAVLVSRVGNQIQLDGWPLLTLGNDAQLIGDLQPNSIVLVTICYDENGNPQIVYMYLIHQPGVIEPPYGMKVEICHKPNGNNPHTIMVSQSAVPAHLGHGDVLGPCP